MKNKKLFFILFTLLLFISLFFTLYTESFGADPKLISTLKKAFEKIEDWLVKIATPAAAVAVGTGLLMKKFSFGDEEKIRTGKKLIKGAPFSYAFILAIDLVIDAIECLIK